MEWSERASERRGRRWVSYAHRIHSGVGRKWGGRAAAAIAGRGRGTRDVAHACMRGSTWGKGGRGQGREPARMSGRRGRKEGHAWNYAAAAVLYSETMGTREGAASFTMRPQPKSPQPIN